MNLIALIVVGLIIGLIGGSLLPGRQSFNSTMMTAIAGSFIGAMAGSFLTTDDRLFELHAGWLFASGFGSVSVLLYTRLMNRAD